MGSRPRAAQAEEGGREPRLSETVPVAAGWGRASDPGLQGVNLTAHYGYVRLAEVFRRRNTFDSSF